MLREDFSEPMPGLLVLWVPARGRCVEAGRWLRGPFGERLWLAVELHRDRTIAAGCTRCWSWQARCAIPAVASGDVHMDVRRAARLAGHHDRDPPWPAGGRGRARLYPNGERHLRTLDAWANSIRQHCSTKRCNIARRCTFDLGQLRYQYPASWCPRDTRPPPGCVMSTEAGHA